MESSGERFKEIMSHFVTGVVVLTCADTGGREAGITLNSFFSVTLSPPVVAVSLQEQSDTLQVVRCVPYFAVHVLAEDQEELARRFAQKVTKKFIGVQVAVDSATGVPLLEDTLAYLVCRRVGTIPLYDHVLVLGEVLEAGLNPEQRPLLYYRRRFTIYREPLYGVVTAPLIMSSSDALEWP